MNVYTFITPIVLVLLLAEIIYSVRTKKPYYNFQDTITNLATGIGNQCVNLAVAFFVFKWYGWLYQFAPWQISTPGTFCCSCFATGFCLLLVSPHRAYHQCLLGRPYATPLL